MDKKGYFTVETALTFPLFMLLLIVLLYILVMYVISEEKLNKDSDDFISAIHNVDSVKRKAEIFDGILE